MDAPDLTGAEAYIARDSIAKGRWYILPGKDGADEYVIYERHPDQCSDPKGQWVQPAVVSASALRTSPSWTRG